MQTLKSTFFLIGLFTLIAPFSYGQGTANCPVTRNAVIDIGSGNTKLRVADVDCHGVVTLVLQDRSRVAYMTAINASADHNISEEVITQGVQAIQSLKVKANDLTPAPTRFTAIATAAFRAAANGAQVAARLSQETAMPVHVVPQEQEGKLGFLAASAQAGVPVNQAIIWDVGGGSMQIAHTSASTIQLNRIQIGRAQYGADTFKDEVITQVQHRELTAEASPNPINATDMAAAVSLSTRRATEQFGRQRSVLAKIRRMHGRVIGIGGVFGKSVKKQIENTPEIAPQLANGVLTAETVNQMVTRRIDRDDDSLRAVLDDGFHRTHATHFALLKGFMHVLDVREVKIIDAETGDGVFSLIRFQHGRFNYGQYW